MVQHAIVRQPGEGGGVCGPTASGAMTEMVGSVEPGAYRRIAVQTANARGHCDPTVALRTVRRAAPTRIRAAIRPTPTNTNVAGSGAGAADAPSTLPLRSGRATSSRKLPERSNRSILGIASVSVESDVPEPNSLSPGVKLHSEIHSVERENVNRKGGGSGSVAYAKGAKEC